MLKSVQIACLLVLLSSCRKQKDLNGAADPSTLTGYYPFEKGAFRIYEIRQSTYLLGQKTDLTYRLKEVFADTFLDLKRETSFKILRYKTTPPVDTFSLDSVWYVKLASNKEVVKVENNWPFVKLTYPIALKSSWNGNRYNNAFPEFYSVTNLQATHKNFENLAEVLQSNDTNLLRRDLRKEMYGVNIGLVYKLTRTVDFSTNTENNEFGKGIITSGIIREEELISYGKE